MRCLLKCGFGILGLLIATGESSNAQQSIKDSLLRIPLMSISYAYQIPGGDLQERYGDNSNIALHLLYKNKRNFFYGMEGCFIFGSDIRESGILDSIRTKSSPGFIIDSEGIPADIRLYERGYSIMLRAGKIFPTRLGPNRNSGFFISGGAGFLQHKIRIEDPPGTVAMVKGDYKKGYDRLTNGFSISEMIGFMYFGNGKLINCYLAIECVQGFTQSRRYDFDLMKKDSSARLDLLNGLRFGWIIPFYKKAPKEYYFY